MKVDLKTIKETDIKKKVTTGKENLKTGRRNFTKEEIIKNIPKNNTFLDGAYVYSSCVQLFNHINKSYFRVKLVGFDQAIKRNNPNAPLILASNHSGMAFPWDAIAFTSKFLEHNQYNMFNSVRALTAPSLSKASFMSPFLIKDFWKRLGAIDAHTINFESAMVDNSSNLLIYPEGVPGIAKGFNHKYQLQRFATSAIRMSIKYKTDIVPFATVNGEFINPYSYSSKRLNKFLQKLGMPFFPIGLSSLLIPLQPWFFYFAFPARLTYVRGKSFKPYEMVEGRALEEVTEEEIKYLAQLLKNQMQTELDDAVSKYGKITYDFKNLIKQWWADRKHFQTFFPSSWPFLFTDQDRKFKIAKEKYISNGEWPLTVEGQLNLAKNVFKNMKRKNLSVHKAMKVIFHHPQILLLYTPIIGLFYLFRYKR